MIRFLEENHDRLAKPSRARVVVLWLDGDQQAFQAWAEANHIQKVQLGVVSSENADLKSWNLNPICRQTLVLSNRQQTLASYGDLEAVSNTRLEERIMKHFRP